VVEQGGGRDVDALGDLGALVAGRGASRAGGAVPHRRPLALTLSPTIDEVMQSEIEKRAERVLEDVPDWIWNGRTLPVPVEDIADSCFGLHVRDVDDGAFRLRARLPLEDEG
jgi:hypothetical protein